MTSSSTSSVLPTTTSETSATTVTTEQDASAKKIQKRLKGLIVRRRIDHVNKVASRIQSIFRMRWFRQVFMTIKSNTMVLQRAVRRYMARRDMIKERMRDYLMQEYQIMENVREMESFMLFNDERNSLVKQ